MEIFTVYDTSQWETRGIVVHHDARSIEHRLVNTPQGVVKDTGDGKLIMVGRRADSRILKLGCDAFTSKDTAVEIVKTKRRPGRCNSFRPQ
jgi:hypothetical protein